MFDSLFGSLDRCWLSINLLETGDMDGGMIIIPKTSLIKLFEPNENIVLFWELLNYTSQAVS